MFMRKVNQKLLGGKQRQEGKKKYWRRKEKSRRLMFAGVLLCTFLVARQNTLVVSAADAENAPKKGSVIAGYLKDPQMDEICAEYRYQAPEGEITATYKSVADMRANAEGLQAGDYIRTENYYENGNGGGAVYQVEASSYTTDNGGTIINLPGAFRCKLVSRNSTVSPLQFGAYGDGKTDDHAALQAALTAGFQTVILDGRTYISNDTIWMGNCNHLLVEGMGATITCDNGFGSYQKEGQENNKQVFITNCKDITFRHIRILDGQTTDHTRGLVSLQSVRNIDITYCTLDIPAGISSNPDYGSCNLSFGNGWHDVSTTHCEIINESGLKTGGAIGYNDCYASGSENALFENNVVRYNVKDEVIAIFSHSREGSDYFGRDSHIRNIMIRHNEFYGPKSDNWKRDLDFSVGYEDSLEVDNVVYEENYFETDAVWAFMSFSKTATNCAARGNVIHVNQTSSQTSMSVFTTTGEFPAVIEDNVIEISSENENIPSGIVNGKLQFRNNQVTTNGSMQYLFTGGAVSEQNQITVNGSVKKALSYQGGDMTDTSITISERAGCMYESYKMDMQKDIIWKDNEIKLSNADSTGALMTFNGMKMNGHHFIMEGNHIETPSVTKNALIIYDALRDDNPREQTIILKDNEFGAYNSKGNTVQIYRTGNVFQLADKSTIMDYEVVFDTEGKAKVESQSVIGGEKVIKPEEPDVRGFVFEGWYKDNTFKNLWDFENDVISGHTILYAKFQKIALKEFSLSHKEIAGNAGEQIQLSASFVPEETLETELSYTSENSKVADVDENGLVRLVGEGKTILTIVSREQPQLKIEIPVIVKQPEKPTEEEPATKELTTEATTTEKPTEKPTEEEPATKEPTTEAKKTDTKIMPEVGTLLTDDRTKAVYRVTSSDGKNATVAYVKPTNKKEVKVIIAKKVTLNEITYRITAIDANAFRGCKKLRYISIGSEIAEIGNAAFYKCTALTKVTIPAKVSKIGKKAFYGCKKLKTITIKTKKLTDKKVGSKAFKGISSKAVAKVPKSRLKNYRKLLRKKGIGAGVKVR